ncbi:PH domain-containing protein [Aeromicrobium sp. CTD01-1L150]|uniref:PH domain-containing protein n=1 Tax=Aeromicrobium sp. CTD01-1L150 TaxID=3341830 RepID=UPI0035C008FE
MTTHRPGGTRYVAYGGCVALVAMSVAITVGLPAEIRAQVSLSQALTLYGCVAAMMLILHGIGRSYVRVDDREIEVVNGFRRHVLTWDQVLGFSFNEGAPWPTLVTKDDERVMLFGIQGSDDTRKIVEDLVRRIP